MRIFSESDSRVAGKQINSETNKLSETISKVSVLFSNVRSIRNKLDFVSIETLTDPSRILCFTETWLSPSFDDRCFPISEYHVFRGDRNYNGKHRKGGGILVLVPKLYDSYQVGEYYCTEAFECITFCIGTENASRYILCVYRPPTTLSDKFFVAEFEKYYYNLRLAAKKVIIVGDFNFPYINWYTGSLERYSAAANGFLRFVLLNSFHQLVNFATRNDHTLDLVLSNDPSVIANLEVREPFGISDHLQVSFEIYFDNRYDVTNFNENYNFHRADFLSIERLLITIPWDSVFANCTSIDDKLALLNNLLLDLFQKFVPVFPNHQHKARVNLPYELIQQRKRVRYLYRKSKGNQESTFYYFYKEELKNYKSNIRNMFLRQEQSILQQKSICKFWNFIRRKTRPIRNIPALIDNGTVVNDDHKKAELFNKYLFHIYTG